jgi:hypothetical protein
LLPEEWKDETERLVQQEIDATINEKYGSFDPDLIYVFDNGNMETLHPKV